jgi:NhaP-type Na+/H+ or K+/H+ antiporter
VAVLVGLAGASVAPTRLAFIGWFGIRGVGSVYYLSYAITHDLQADVARTLAMLTLSVVAASILVHGISVTPLMRRYERQQVESDVT